eukprot:5764-Heterococcus_DN1.PRE.1
MQQAVAFYTMLIECTSCGCGTQLKIRWRVLISSVRHAPRTRGVPACAPLLVVAHEVPLYSMLKTVDNWHTTAFRATEVCVSLLTNAHQQRSGKACSCSHFLM